MALCVLLLISQRVRAQEASEEVVDKITQMNKDAIAAYQAKKYEDARKILKQALDAASGAGLDNHPITARTHVHLGVVIIVGFSQRDLGIKQFKKAIEIQPDINLTKALVTPELADAFAEAKKAAPAGGAVAAAPAEGKPAASPPAAPAAAAPAAAPASPPAEEAGNGLVHEAVTEAKQGSAISITAGVQSDLHFERLVLAYRPDGASEFLGREMKQVSDGQYSAEIPPAATSGSVVAYYIEAEDADGGLVTARGSVDAPLVIHLAGVGAARRTSDEDTDDDDDEPDKRYFVGLMAGTGFGWATGQGDTNADVAINPSGLALAGVGQIAPEVGYWLTSSLLLSGQIRYEYISGTTDIYTTNPMHQYHTANYALALFAKATWRYGEGEFHPFFSLAAGGGRIRHVVSYHQLQNCGPNHNETCVDTIGAGPVLLGPGAGLMYDINDQTALVVQVNSVLGFPTFTVNVDANVGVAFGF